MVLITRDYKDVWRRHEVEVIFNEAGKIEHMGVPFIIEGHIAKEIWLDTPIKSMTMDVNRPNYRFGSSINLNHSGNHEFFEKYGP